VSAIDSHKVSLFDYTLELADDLLIIGHRLSEWCGHGPILEEDIALTNIALDNVGQAKTLLEIAGKLEGKGRSADDLAFLREATEFRNCLLAEQEKGDFADTVAGLLYFDAYFFLLLSELKNCSWKPLSEFSAKAVKETTYHLRHASQWVLRLGDGTGESHERMQKALDRLWGFVDELFTPTKAQTEIIQAGLIPDSSALRPKWDEMIQQVIEEATLSIPTDEYKRVGGREGLHSELLGHLLAEMQITARSYPNAEW